MASADAEIDVQEKQPKKKFSKFGSLDEVLTYGFRPTFSPESASSLSFSHLAFTVVMTALVGTLPSH